MADDAHAEISWVATTQIGARPDKAVLNRYFHAEPRTSLFRSRSVSERLWVVPQGLSPRDGFHRLATRAALNHEVSRTPYPRIKITPRFTVQISSLSADLFPGDVLTVTINAKAWLSDAEKPESLMRDLKAARLPKRIAVVDSLVREAIMLVQGNRDADARLRVNYDDYFLMALELSQTPDMLDNLLDKVKAETIALLIGAANEALLRPELIADVNESSAGLNTKAIGERLLINRQGALYIQSAGHYNGPHSNRFARSRELVRLALYTRAFLRDERQFSVRHRRLADFIIRRLEQWIEYPDLTFDASVSETRTWEVLLEQLLLHQRLSAWTQLNRGSLDGQSLNDIALLEPAWWTEDALNSLLNSRVNEDIKDGGD
jgi:hypothetical protein